jgi:nitroreductase
VTEIVRTPIGRDVLLAAVDAAVLAPSLYNRQPWRFGLTEHALDVYAETSGWAAHIACGAAATNAHLALAAAGVPTRMRLLPDPDEPDLLIRLDAEDLDAEDEAAPAHRDVALAAEIPRRHTNRLPFYDTPVPAAAIAALRAAAAGHDVWLEILIGRMPLIFITEMVSAADRALRHTPDYRDELVDDSSTYAPGYDFRAEPLMVVLGTATDSPRDQITAGIALQYVLLAATQAGLGVSLRSQPVRVPSAREQLRVGLRRSGSPQIVARIGYAPPAVATGRRAVSTVVPGR